MAEKGFKRKLTAILSADVEEATVRILTAYHEVITAPKIYFSFGASGVDYLPDGTGAREVGTTTFSDVSWIIDDGTIPFPFPDPTQPSPDLNNPIPEPVTMLLFATGLIELGGYRRKLRKKQ